MGADSCW